MRRTALLMTYLYFLICPIEFVLNKYYGSSVKYIALLAIGSIILYFILDNSQKIKIGKIQICLIIWSAMQIASVLWTAYYEYTYMRLFSYILMAVLVIMLSVFPFKPNELENAIRAYTIGCIVLSLMLIFTGSLDGGGNSEGRLTIKVLDSYFDPNNLAANILTGLFFCFGGVWKKYKTTPIANIIYAAFFIVQVVAIVLTGSRGGMLSFLVGVIVYCLVKSKKNKRYIIGLVLGIFVGFIIAKQFMPEGLFNRIFAIENYTTGTGRTTIWSNALNKLLSSPLFGFGIASYHSFFEECFGGATAMHNSFLAVLFEVGVVGFTCFMLPILLGIYNAFKTKRATIIAIIISNMGAAFFLDALHTRYLWNAIAFVVIWYEIQKRKEREELKEKLNV